MSALDEGLRRLYDRLAGTGLPLFVGGAVAAMWYGEPRTTLDIDVIVQATAADAERIAQAFPTPEFYVPPRSVLRQELGRTEGGQFNVIDLASGMKADVYVAGDDPLIAFGFAHATVRDLAGHPLRLAPATYIVAMKLRYFGVSCQDKHLRDIRSVLALSPGEVDVAEVTRWAERFGVVEAWRSCLARPGEEG